MIKAVYPGTFDPITRGHEDLVRRAATLFDEVVVGVADSHGKNPFFTLEERLRLAREVLKPYRNVRIEGFGGLLMEFVRGEKARVILRGLRAGSEFEYEVQVAGARQVSGGPAGAAGRGGEVAAVVVLLEIARGAARGPEAARARPAGGERGEKRVPHGRNQPLAAREREAPGARARVDARPEQ